MRIVAGEWRGRQIGSPTWEGLRPTSDRLRETLFNILGPSILGARVLDGFAGTGAIGLEALSRGAAHVTFVEKDPRAVKLIASNFEKLRAETTPKPAIIRAGFADAVKQLGGDAFDLIVLDPPYAEGAAAEALDGAAGLVTAGGGTRVVVEHATRHPPPAERAGLRLARTVRAGDSAVSFYER